MSLAQWLARLPSGWQSCTRLLTVFMQLLRKSYRLPPGIVCWRAQPKGSVLAPFNLHRGIAEIQAHFRITVVRNRRPLKPF